jgi:GNAT superfamily N-acetyltransferase
MPDFELRPMTEADRAEVAELIYASINFWYRAHGQADIFRGGPAVTEVFYDVYNDLTPGANVVAVNPRTGRLMGSCFYHPRPLHVSLGIMTVHPNYFGQGVGGALLRHIMAVADREQKPLRLTQSAINIDSFSLYNKAGFVPRYAYQDMFLPVPEAGLKHTVPGLDRVRGATPADVPAMAALEREVSGISRELDYRYCIDNRRAFWSVSVVESPRGEIDGFMISSGHPAMNLLGPCVARSEAAAAALLLKHLNLYPGRAPLFLLPMDKTSLVRRAYDWGARVCEMHFCQVRGAFQPFAGVNMPSFLPETG